MKLGWKIKVEADPSLVASPCIRLETRTHFLYLWRRGWRPGILLAPVESREAL